MELQPWEALEDGVLGREGDQCNKLPVAFADMKEEGLGAMLDLNLLDGYPIDCMDNQWMGQRLSGAVEVVDSLLVYEVSC